MSVRLGLRLSQAELDVQNKGSLSGLVAICKCEKATLTAEALNKVCQGCGSGRNGVEQKREIRQGMRRRATDLLVSKQLRHFGRKCKCKGHG